MEAWSGIQETIYLQSIPQMEQSIHDAAAESIEDGIDAAEVDFDTQNYVCEDQSDRRISSPVAEQ
ncbi:hypothetical protein FACS189487_10230 [Campylobacterota bacterium]|nr:hypothetical protein FACS189487_10230 [Campylobacterota bacterium]